MTDSERQQVLKMIEDGKISAEQGLILMQALDAAPEDGSDEEAQNQILEGLPEPSATADSFLPDSLDPTGNSKSERARTDPDFERKLNRFRNLWVVPLWVGVTITVCGAYGMYAALRSGGLGFWFYFAWLPFLLGVVVTALAFSSRSSRWIYINIQQKKGESPQKIVLTFPLSLVTWIVNFVKFSVPAGEVGPIKEVMSALFESTQSSEPLLVDVQEEDGEHVQIYIG